jgi:hypothetical protein
MPTTEEMRTKANAEALRRMNESEPVLIDVQPAGSVVPGMTPETILTSGRPMAWPEYRGGQRRSLIYGAIYEGLAIDEADAVAKFDRGEIRVGACHEHGCVGSVAGIYTASMPVFIVENAPFGTTGFCNFYEGASPRRLNYGAYDDGVRDGLLFIQDVVAPVVGEAVRRTGGVPLKPLMRRAIHMGDELHSRNTAATVLFARALVPKLFELYADDADRVDRSHAFLTDNEYSFLRLSMASAKAIADAAHGVEGSSVVSAMTISCNGFALRVSGLDGWYDGPHAVVEAKLFEGYTPDDIEWIGGESLIAETVGLGGFAQAAAFALQTYQGGSAEAMVENNLKMYEITVGENATFQIPFLGYRGTPTAVDVFKVVESGVTPMIDGVVAGRDGGQIGAGILRAPIECFIAAEAAWRDRYGT